MMTRTENTMETAELQENCRRLVDREVYYCVSELVSEIVNDPAQRWADQLYPVLVTDDWEEAAIQEGWTRHNQKHSGIYDGHYFEKIDQGQRITWTCETWQELCEEFDIEPYQREAYEHWIVSDWLADKLEAKGEMVVRDFLGLTIWGRTTTGQAIYIDRVIEEIYADMQAERAKWSA